jgi:hypothetical protein
MGAMASLLRPGERVHLVTREHGVVLVRPFLRAIITLAIAALAAHQVAGAEDLGLLPQAVAVVALVVSVLALLRLLGRVARWHTRRLVVTDRKVVLVSGLLHRRVTALPIAAVDEVAVSRRPSPTPRCGTVIVSTAGRRSTLMGVRRLPHPERVAMLLLRLSAEATTGERRAARPVEQEPLAL